MAPSAQSGASRITDLVACPSGAAEQAVRPLAARAVVALLQAVGPTAATVGIREQKASRVAGFGHLLLCLWVLRC